MYSLIRSLIGENEARMLIQLRVVVSTTRISDRPSTPTLYWIPNNGIQSTCSTSWKPVRAVCGSKAIRRSSENPHATRLAPRASRRA